jgi:hypothetical protein
LKGSQPICENVDLLTAAFENLLLLDNGRLDNPQDQRSFVLHGIGLRDLASVFGWCNESLSAGIAFTA